MPHYILIEKDGVEGNVEAVHPFVVKKKKTVNDLPTFEIAELLGVYTQHHTYQVVSLDARPLDLDGIIAQRQQSA